MKNIDIVKTICKVLGKPETMFKDGIFKTIQWYLDNR